MERCQQFVRLAILTLAVGTPGMVQAQGDSLRVTVPRANTPFEQQVERLARQLVGQQQRVFVLSRTRDRLQGTLRSIALPEVQRGQLTSQLRGVVSEISVLDASRVSLRRQLEALCAPTMGSEGWLGVAFNGEFTMDATPEGMLMAVRRPPEVESVEPGSPAEKAGLRRGDLLLSLGGHEMSDAVIRLSDLLKPGARLPVRRKRGTDTRTVFVTIEPRPADFRPTCAWEDDMMASALGPSSGSFAFVVAPEGNATATIRLGQQNPFTIESRTGERVLIATPSRPGTTPSGFMFTTGPSARLLAGTQLLAVNDGIAAVTGVARGVFVAEVARRSIAAQSGLVAGDVIVAAAGRPVTSPGALVQLMEQAESRELELQVVRHKKTETVVLKW